MGDITKKTFHFTVLFFEICLTYDGLVSKALPLRTSSPGRFFYRSANKIKHGFIASESICHTYTCSSLPASVQYLKTFAGTRFRVKARQQSVITGHIKKRSIKASLLLL